MHLFNKKKNNSYVIAGATLLTLAITAAALSIATPIAATPTIGNTTIASSSGIGLSSQPIYQERAPPGNITPINQTHISATHSGNGTLTLPNTTQTINTTSNGTAIISFATSSAIAKSTIRAANGETATATIYEIVQFTNPAAAPQGGGKGIVTVIFQTNSTGILAPLNGMILAGIDDLAPNGESDTTLWRWESGIPLSTNTTTSTSTATTSETNATAETGEESIVEEEAVGGAQVAE